MALLANFLLMALALVMAVRLLQRYRDRPRAHTLAYAVSFLLIAAAAFFDFFAHIAGAWPEMLYLLYWVTVATLVPVMATGTVYIFHAGAGRIFLALTVLLGVWMLLVALGLPVDPAVLVPGDIGSLKPAPVLAPFTKNLPRIGVVIILAGTFWTWYKSRRAFVLWIALGTILFTLAGILAVRVGSLGFYALQALAIIAFYRGLGARADLRVRAPVPTRLQTK